MEIAHINACVEEPCARLGRALRARGTLEEFIGAKKDACNIMTA